MIETFEAKDFKCYEHLKLTSLKRINVITGANASGKSALLEAIYLASQAVPSALVNINGSRLMGAGPLALPGGGITFSFGATVVQTTTALFGNLFRTTSKKEKGPETARAIELRFEDSAGDIYEVNLSFAPPPGEDAPPTAVGVGPTSSPLLLAKQRHNKNGGGLGATNAVTINPQTGQLQQTGAPESFGPQTFIFGPTTSYSENDNIMWFSQLRIDGSLERIVSFIKNEFPFISGIEVLAPNGVNGIYASMSDGSTRRLTAVSSGIYKIVSILLGCAMARNGAIVIDEIENGIFYEKYGAVWDVLLRFARETNNQLFISTHSDECLQSLLPTLRDNEEEFSLLRTEHEGDTFVVRQVSGVSMRAALQRGGEIRGTEGTRH